MKSRLGTLLIIVSSITFAQGCSSAPKVKDGSFTNAPISVSMDYQAEYQEGMDALNRGAWDESQATFSKIQTGESGPAQDAAKLFVARASLKSLNWLADGSLPPVQVADPPVQNAFSILRSLVETPGVDPRVHYTARLYLAAIYMLDHQKDEAYALLKDYPSGSLSELVVPADRIPIRLMLAEALSRNKRHEEAAYAYQATFEDYHAYTQAGGNSDTLETTATETRSVFKDLLLDLTANEVAVFNETQLKDAVAKDTGDYVRQLALLEVMKKEARQTDRSDSENQSILQTLTEIEPAINSMGRGSEIAALRHLLDDKVPIGGVKNIGVLLPLSGPQRQYGLHAQQAILVAASGFEQGSSDVTVKTRFLFEDSNGNKNAIVERFKKNNTLAVIGPLTPTLTEEFAQPLADAHIPLVSLSAKRPSNIDDPYVFSFYVNALQEAKSMGKLATEIGDTRAAVLYANNGYGRAMSTAFTEAFKANGGEVILSEGVESKLSNYTELAKRILAAKPQTIFIATRAEKVAELTSFLAQQNMWGIDSSKPAQTTRNGRVYLHYLGTSVWPENILLKQSYSYINGALIPAWSSSLYDNGPVGDRVESQFLSAIGAAPDPFKIIAADAALLAMNYIGQRHIETSEQFQNELLHGAPFKGIAGDVRFAANGEVDRKLRLLEIKNGQLAVSSVKQLP